MSRAVFVLGMHRSGTSAFMRLLAAFGVYLGDNLIEPQEDNPKGFFEDRALLDLNSGLLGSVAENGRYGLLSLGAEFHDEETFRTELRAYLESAYAGCSLWGFKDPRLCLTFRSWRDVLRDLGVSHSFLVPVRNPLEVAQSLQKREGWPIGFGLTTWFLYMFSALEYAAAAPSCFVAFKDLFGDVRGVMERVGRFLGEDCLAHGEALDAFEGEFLDAGLYRNRDDDAQLEANCRGMESIPDFFASLMGFCADGTVGPEAIRELLGRHREAFASLASSIAGSAPDYLRAEMHENSLTLKKYVNALEDCSGALAENVKAHEVCKENYAKLQRRYEDAAQALEESRQALFDSQDALQDAHLVIAERDATIRLEQQQLAEIKRSKAWRFLRFMAKFGARAGVVGKSGRNLRKGMERVEQMRAYKRAKAAHALSAAVDAAGREEIRAVEALREQSRRGRHVVFMDYDFPEFDAHAGGRHSWLYVKLLADLGFAVTFLAQGDEGKLYIKHLESIGVHVPDRSFFMGASWGNWLYMCREEINFVVASRPFPSVKYVGLIRDLMRVPLIYFAHDLHFLRLGRQQEQTGDVCEGEISRCRTAEDKLIRRCSHMLTPSTFEVEYVAEHFGKQEATAIPVFFYDDEMLAGHEGEKESGSLLFVGSFEHAPNRAALVWFVEKVLPLIVERHGDAILSIIGSKPPEHWGLGEHVRLLGRVSEEELEQAYRKSRVAIAPLLFGAGVKGKVIESMAMNCPVVGTTIAFEGIPAGEMIVPVDSPEQFADRVSHYLDMDDAGYRSVQAGLRQYMKQYFSEDTAKALMEKVVSSVDTDD
ncbi:MAG: glycosyltransferase [Desulfovibrionaceae bacterium]|nr:glycosyltransferase [Desulfovibrionaceae bacterium]